MVVEQFGPEKNWLTNGFGKINGFVAKSVEDLIRLFPTTGALVFETIGLKKTTKTARERVGDIAAGIVSPRLDLMPSALGGAKRYESYSKSIKTIKGGFKRR